MNVEDRYEGFFSNETSAELFRDRYSLDGKETPDDTIRRVSKFLSTTHEEQVDFFDVMYEGKAYPAGRTMANSGVGKHLTLNNCFVPYQIPNDMGEIYECVKIGALTHKAGGGTGYDFSLLSPNGTTTHNNAIASGPVSFMKSFDAQTDTVKTGNRRGANMGVLNVYHPDIYEFITAKAKDQNILQYFNISVMVDDAFMEAVENDESIWLHYPVYNDEGEIETDKNKWEQSKQISAKALWDEIMTQAYNTGEPGVLQYDTMNKDNNLWYVENMVATNPCGEYLAGTLYGDNIDPKKYGGACNLGSIVLHKFVKDPFTDHATFDEYEFTKTVRTMVRMLDNTIDVNTFPVDIYENYQKTFRTIGLGITSLADTLAMLGMKYNSKEALEWVDYLMEHFAYIAYSESVELAKEKGAFPMFRTGFANSGYILKHCNNGSEHNKAKWLRLRDDIKIYGIRNARLISVAPTGTLSLVWGNNCSSGIEPIFSLEYDRVAKIGGQEEEDKRTIHVEDYAYSVAKKLGADTTHMTTALDMTVDEHIDMLSVIAYHTDMSVSKTINVPTDYPFEDAKNIYMRCWKEGIKGCTIFRPNEIRQGILGVSNDTEKSNETDIHELRRGDIIGVSDDLIGFKRRIRTGCGVFYFSVWFDEFDGTPLETFIDLSKAGGCERNLQFESKMMSKMLRGGIDAREIIDAGKEGFPCLAYCNRKKEYGDTAKGVSCPSALAWALEDLIAKMKDRCFSDLDMGITEEEFEEAMLDAPVKIATKVCPECGEPMPDGVGCLTCVNCGYNSCEHH